MAANKAASAGSARVPVAEGEALPELEATDGGHSAIEALYHSQSPRLMRMLRRRVADGEEARDMLHEIFARMARLGTSTISKLDRPEAYLTRIASNLISDRARRNMATGWPVVLEECDLASGIDPVSHLETRDMLARIEAAMNRLKPRTREIFMAHRLEGMSYGEIAERFGMSVKGVEKQMSKAIAQIDRMLGRR